MAILAASAAPARLVAAAAAAAAPPRCLPAAAPVATRRGGRGAGVRRVVSTAATVRDAMNTADIITCSPNDTIDHAMELLVDHGIPGMPVVDGDQRVVGVLSNFDLLALVTCGVTQSGEIFPEADQTWQAFLEVRKALAKGKGQHVSDVMTPQPLTVAPDSDVDEAARVLLSRRIRRLPVVDEQGRLLGQISQGDLIRCALHARRQGASPAGVA